MAGTTYVTNTIAAYIDYQADKHDLTTEQVASILRYLVTVYTPRKAWECKNGHTGTGSESQPDSKDVSLQKL